MTQERVADLLGVHKRTVENDEATASAGVWQRLNDYARIYGQPVERLLWGDEVEFTDPDGSLRERLTGLEARVEEQGRAVSRALRALVKEVRALEPLQEPATPPAKRAARS